MSFDARQSVVGRLLNDAIYRIPRNQRMYVWKEDNWNDLFQDIELVTNGVSSSHFIGSIVLMEEVAEEGLSVFTIIDGQQRIITLTILLSSILYAFKRRGLFEDAGGTKKYLVATDVKNNEHVIVLFWVSSGWTERVHRLRRPPHLQKRDAHLQQRIH